MSYTRTTAFQTGTAGQTVSAQLVNTTGSNVGSAVTTGFVDLGGGFYEWTYASYPDGFRGVVKFSVSGTIKAIEAVNPEEGEYLDTKVSTRATIAQIEALGTIVSGGGSVFSNGTVGGPNDEPREIVRGDDYYAADGRQLTWARTDWPDLTSATITLTARKGSDSFTASGSVVTPTGSQEVQVELPSATTVDLPVGLYKYDVQAILSGGHEVTLALSELKLLPDVTT